MPIIETEIWKRSPDNPRALIFDSQRVAQDIFNELEAHLKTEGRMPDEYFLFDAHGNWKDGALFPRDAQVLCSVNYGGSEGIYLDISVQYEKEVYEYSRENGVLGWHKRTVIEPFATGKTLGETIDDLDKMNLVASSVTAAFYGMEAEVKERYAKIERGEIMPPYPPPFENPAIPTAQTIYGEVQAGDWVIVAGDHSCIYLIGQVTNIAKLGTQGHRKGHELDDVYVDITAFKYPTERISEIEEHFSRLYGEPKRFEELPLHSICIPPDKLIRISHLDYDEITRMGSLRANCEAFCNCFPRGERPEGKLGELMERLDTNLEDYQDSLMGFGKRELIEMAEKITAMSDVHLFLTEEHEFEDSEIEYLLQFQNPLEVVADAWVHQREDIGDLAYMLDDVFGNQDLLQQYPLVVAPVGDRFAGASNDLKAEHEKIVHAVQSMDYGMDAAEFEAGMAALFPEGNSNAASHWISSAADVDAEIGHPRTKTLLEYYIEFGLVKQQFGDEIALRLFNNSVESCPAVYELRAAARLLQEGMEISIIHDQIIQNDLMTTPSEDIEFGKALIAFVECDTLAQSAAIPLTDEQATAVQDLTGRTERNTGHTALTPPAVKKSIGDRLREGNEKVQSYKDQQAQNPPTTTKQKKEAIDQ